MTEQVKIILAHSQYFYIIFFLLLNIYINFFVTDALQQGASQFEQQAGKLKRKFWLQNLKVCSYIIQYWETFKNYEKFKYFDQ